MMTSVIIMIIVNYDKCYNTSLGVKGTYPIFLETFLFVDRFKQNLHSICKMKNKIYVAPDIFPVFFVVFFLFTILWTNCNKIVFTQIPKALSVLVLEKKKQRVFWKAR